MYLNKASWFSSEGMHDSEDLRPYSDMFRLWLLQSSGNLPCKLNHQNLKLFTFFGTHNKIHIALCENFRIINCMVHIAVYLETVT